MTKLYYSALPPDVQLAIQKLTGYSDEQLRNDEKGISPAKPTKTKKEASSHHQQHKPQTDTLAIQALGVLVAMVAAAIYCFSCQ